MVTATWARRAATARADITMRRSVRRRAPIVMLMVGAVVCGLGTAGPASAADYVIFLAAGETNQAPPVQTVGGLAIGLVADRDQAYQIALSNCVKHGGHQCVVVQDATNACAAVATNDFGETVGASEVSLQNAQNNALRKLGNQQGAHIVESGCANGFVPTPPPAPPTAPAQPKPGPTVSFSPIVGGSSRARHRPQWCVVAVHLRHRPREPVLRVASQRQPRRRCGARHSPTAELDGRRQLRQWHQYSDFDVLLTPCCWSDIPNLPPAQRFSLVLSNRSPAGPSCSAGAMSHVFTVTDSVRTTYRCPLERRCSRVEKSALRGESIVVGCWAGRSILTRVRDAPQLRPIRLEPLAGRGRSVQGRARRHHCPGRSAVRDRRSRRR